MANMKTLAALFLPLIFVSCGMQNSVMADAALYGSASYAGQSASFIRARTVLLVSCVQCHSVWVNYAEKDYLAYDSGERALVVKGDPGSSRLYTELRGAGHGGSMPPYRQLTDADIQAIHDWIAQIQ